MEAKTILKEITANNNGENRNSNKENENQNKERKEITINKNAENFDKKENTTQTNEIILNKNRDKNEGKINTSSETKLYNRNYSFFAHFNFNVIIFEVNDKFFGEDLKYDKVEYNLLYSIKNDFKDLKKKINNIDKKIIRQIDGKYSVEFKNINDKLDQLLNNKKIS